MEYTNVYRWISQEKQHRDFLMAITQPMTARQIARKTGIPVDTCSCLIARFSDQGLLTCLNPAQRNSRLYWITGLGAKCKNQLYQDLDLCYKKFDVSDTDWQLYGWVCFKHRSAVIRTLSCPMQPSEIKRFLRIHHPNMKISANNVRDVIKLLLAKNIVRPVKIRKKAHLRYELTDLGNQLRKLLLQAQAGSW